MYNQKMISLPLYSKSTTLSDYKQEVENYTKIADIDVAIGLNLYAEYNPEGMNVIKSKFCGYTEYQGIQQGMKIGDNYIVEYAIEKNRGTFLYLKEITSDRR